MQTISFSGLRVTVGAVVAVGLVVVDDNELSSLTLVEKEVEEEEEAVEYWLMVSCRRLCNSFCHNDSMRSCFVCFGTTTIKISNKTLTTNKHLLRGMPWMVTGWMRLPPPWLVKVTAEQMTTWLL